MKKQILVIAILFVLGLTNSVKAQLLIPEFETPTKIEELNSDDEESLPFPYSEGEKIYFVRTTIIGSMKERVKGQDIWSSEFNGTNWTEPSNLFEEVNDNGNNAVIGTSRDGNTVYVFNSIQTRRNLAKGIAVTKKDSNGEWSDLEKLEIPGFEIGEGLNTFYISPDEKTLLIGMAPSDTTSQNDLFVSLKGTDGKWGEVINLGPTINSSGTELSPFIDETGTNLYFASTGHEGLGNSDIFMSKRLDDTWQNWTKPLNLGEPINSSEFDAYFIIGNNKEVFFTSNRGGMYSDIYSTKVKEKVVIANDERILAQFNFEAMPVDNVDLLIFDEKDNLIEKATTDEFGKFSFRKIDGNDGYKIKLDSTNDNSFVDAKIYLIDEEGKKLQRLNPEKNGVFGGELGDDDTELVEGLFEYNKLPQGNTALVVLDKNGFPVDTIMTDESGKFSYRKLKTDKIFSVRPLINEEVDINELALFTTDEKGTKREAININNDGLIEKVEDAVAVNTSAKQTDKKVTNTDRLAPKSETVKTNKPKKDSDLSTASMQNSEETIYFNFNEMVLSKDDKKMLDKTIKKLKSDINKNVTLTGFTDNIGTKTNNMEVASARARAARQHLLDNGIKRSRITIYGYVEVMFKGDNSTEEGRALNRRVEVSYQ